MASVDVDGAPPGEALPIRVLLADDHALVRGAMAALLATDPGLEVVAQVGSGTEVVEAARRSRAQVALVDIQMPGLDGFAVTGQLRRELPQVAVLVVTSFTRPGHLRRALDAGARGFLPKDSPAESLARAVHEVHAGRRVIDPDLALEYAVTGPNPLTEREREVLRRTALGQPVARIAEGVHLSAGTVRNLLSSAISKTRATNRIEAARRASELGWL